MSLKAILLIWFLSLVLTAVLGAAFLQYYLLAVVLSEVALALPPLLFLLWKRSLLHSFGLVKRPSAKDFLLGLIVGPVSLGLDAAVNYPILLAYPPPSGYLEELTRFAPRSLPDLTVWLVIILLFVGPCEELLSRGFVQRGLERRLHPRAGLVLGSILFGLMHLSPWSSVGVVAAGLVIGYVYQRRGYSLWAPIGVHVGHDWLAFTALYLSLAAG